MLCVFVWLLLSPRGIIFNFQTSDSLKRTIDNFSSPFIAGWRKYDSCFYLLLGEILPSFNCFLWAGGGGGGEESDCIYVLLLSVAGLRSQAPVAAPSIV